MIIKRFHFGVVGLIGLSLSPFARADLRVCSGDLSARQLGKEFGRDIQKICVADTAGGIQMKMVHRGADGKEKTLELFLPGETHREVLPNDAGYYYLNTFKVSPEIREKFGTRPETQELRYSVSLKKKDSIRKEGALANLFHGEILRFTRNEGERLFNLSHRIGDIHFYRELPPTKVANLHWGYDGDTGPDFWGKLQPEYESCMAGEEQSPIHLKREIAKAVGPSPLELRYRATTLSFVNNGHALQADVPRNNFLRLNGVPYQLLQFHAHHPSEHVLDGKTYDMEIHFVHQAADKRRAVVGVFIEASDSFPDNPRLEEILKEFPRAVNEPKEFSSQIDPAAFLPPLDKRAYFAYPGSLTTPPCSEPIAWHVFEHPIRVSTRQKDLVLKILQGDNARRVTGPESPALPLHGREIRYSSK